jgi:CheY-like chemotaxis protein
MPPQCHPQQVRAVVVEDSDTTRRLFARLLQRQGLHVVFTAEHGADCLRQAQQLFERAVRSEPAVTAAAVETARGLPLHPFAIASAPATPHNGGTGSALATGGAGTYAGCGVDAHVASGPSAATAGGPRPLLGASPGAGFSSVLAGVPHDHRTSAIDAQSAGAAAGAPLSAPGDFLDANIDIWFTDASMPVMDGLALTRHLRSAGVRNPIIGVTGNSLPEDLAAFRGAGVNAVLVKPCNAAKLVTLLDGLGL